MATLNFTLRITMQSDWHIGSGQGRHRSVDRLVDRDHDDLPFIPASTARGIWRDAAQTLARGLDDGIADGPWSKLPDQIFGSEPSLDEKSLTPPIPSRMMLGDCRFPDAAHFIGDAAGYRVLRQALTFVKPGVAMDPLSGGAKKDFLRDEEVARRRAVLEAPGTLDCPEGHQHAIAALLVGAAALLERLGGKRRRGMGKCSVEVQLRDGLAQDVTSAAAVLEATASPPIFETHTAIAHQPRQFSVGTAASAWRKFPLTLTLLSPAVIADEVQGNVITCQDLIPGTLLLPYIARRLDAAGIANVWSLISAGDIRVLPATPDIDGERSLPIPLRWEKPKMGPAGQGIRLIPRTLECAGPQYAPLRAGFVSAATPVRLLGSVAKILRTHNTILDEIQRPDESIGGVYTYEAIAADQHFRSELWLRVDGADENKIAAKLDGQMHVGRARQAGYGRIEVRCGAPIEDALEPIRCDKAISDAVLSIWLTSDAILPGTDQTYGGLQSLAEAVARALGKTSAALFDQASAAQWGNLRWRRIDSWQSQWGLPRPTLLALQAGSVAEFRLNAGARLDTDDIGRLEREGIGERKGEGFGCVVANHTYLSVPPAGIETQTPKSFRPTSTPSSLSAFARIVHRHAWERCIALRAEVAVSEVTDRQRLLKWSTSGPTMSQLGALRAVLGQLTESDLGNVKSWIKRLEKVDGRRRKWEVGEGKSALKILEGLIAAPATVWPALGLREGTDSSPFESAPTPAVSLYFDHLADRHLQLFAVRTLLLTAMRFHKREIERASQRTSQAAGVVG